MKFFKQLYRYFESPPEYEKIINTSFENEKPINKKNNRPYIEIIQEKYGEECDNAKKRIEGRLEQEFINMNRPFVVKYEEELDKIYTDVQRITEEQYWRIENYKQSFRNENESRLDIYREKFKIEFEEECVSLKRRIFGCECNSEEEQRRKKMEETRQRVEAMNNATMIVISR